MGRSERTDPRTGSSPCPIPILTSRILTRPTPTRPGAPVLIPAPPPARLGTGTFTIEGRSAPALFVVGWLATIVGIGLIAVGFMSSNPDSARILIVVGLIPLSVGLIAGAGSQAIERRVRGRLPYQGPSPFLVLFASVPISLLALLVVSVPLAFVGVPLDGPFGALVSVTVQAAVYIGLVRLLVVDAGALDWAAMGVSRPDRRAVAEGLRGAAWALPIVFVTGIVVSILLRAVPVEPVSPLPPTGTNIGFALSLLAGVVIAPFGEEILFRGIRHHGLGPRSRRHARGRARGAGVRLRACRDDLGLQRGRRLLPGLRRVRRQGADRPGPRLAVRPPQDGLGVVRAPRGVQRDPAGHRRDRRAIVVVRVWAAFVPRPPSVSRGCITG